MYAQVHRFQDLVAIWLPGSGTRYVSQAEAIAIAQALRATAKSIGTEAFEDSKDTTVTVELRPNRMSPEPE